MEFNMWSDYLGLNATLKDMPGHASSQDPGTSPSSQEGPEIPAAAADVTCSVNSPLPADGSPAFSSCSFCKHNGEAPSLYSTHCLKDNTGKVQCPVLRSYVCPQCGATGEQAHTRRFCPLTKDTYTSVYHHSSRRPEGKQKKK